MHIFGDFLVIDPRMQTGIKRDQRSVAPFLNNRKLYIMGVYEYLKFGLFIFGAQAPIIYKIGLFIMGFCLLFYLKQLLYIIRVIFFRIIYYRFRLFIIKTSIIHNQNQIINNLNPIIYNLTKIIKKGGKVGKMIKIRHPFFKNYI